MTKAEHLLQLADEIEAATVPIPLDLVLLRDDRALIVETLRLAAQADAPAPPQQMREALNEVITNGEWTKGDQCGEWKISKEVYDLAVDALAHTHPDDRSQEVREALEIAEDVLSRAPFSTAIWPNGMHPNTGIEKIRKALALTRPDGNTP
jgi:hypothetical protein